MRHIPQPRNLSRKKRYSTITISSDQNKNPVFRIDIRAKMVELIINNLQKKIKINQKRIKQVLKKVLTGEGINCKGELTLCFINDREMRKLNKKFAGKDNPTDVLAFNIDRQNDKRLYGDIIVSVDTAIRNAKLFKSTPAYELELYSVHGLLHLLGYKDHSPVKTRIMRRKERKYVNTQN